MRAILQILIKLLILPGDWVSDRLGVSREQNRELVRMLANGFFWILVAIAGLAIWTSTLSIYN